MTEALRRVPPEIWREIFDQVTFVPGLMDITLPDAFDSQTTLTPDHPFESRSFKGSLSTARKLVLVCKEWYDLATPVLYRCVVVRHARAAASLRNTLEASALRAESSNQPSLGSWTRHLIIDVNQQERLGGAVRHLRNLQSLTIGAMIFPQSQFSIAGTSFADLAIETFVPSLQRLHVDFRGSITSSDVVMRFLPHARQLRTFSINDYATRGPTAPVSPSPASPFLSTVTVECASPDTYINIGTPIPTLRCAILRDICWHDQRWLHFLTVQGRFLTTLHVDFTRYAQRETEINWQAAGALIAQHCPHVTHLFLYLSAGFREIPLIDHPSATHIGLLFEPGRVRSILPLYVLGDQVAQSLKPIYAEPDSEPKTVRFLDAEARVHVHEYLQNPRGAELAQAVAAGAIILEDHRGERLEPVVKPPVTSEAQVAAEGQDQMAVAKTPGPQAETVDGITQVHLPIAQMPATGQGIFQLPNGQGSVHWNMQGANLQITVAIP